jgi:hypothetical protein
MEGGYCQSRAGKGGEVENGSWSLMRRLQKKQKIMPPKTNKKSCHQEQKQNPPKNQY